MQGGLGNQLFCLAFAHAIQRLTEDVVTLDLASYGADRYGHDFDLAPLAARLGMMTNRRPLLSSRPITALMRRLRVSGYVSEGSPPLDAPALAALCRRGVYFNGYWQDERYFAGGEFRNTVRAFLMERAGSVTSHAVVLHCRTYKEEVRLDRRVVPDQAWFERAFAHLDARGVGRRDVALISDDPGLALSRLGAIGAGIEPISGGDMWSDMALMLRARALILTNSSFSWWGGYCGEAEAIAYPAKGALFHYAEPARRFDVVV